MNRRQQVGQTGETVAVRFLKKKGYKIVAQNYTTPVGEIDIIAKDRKRIVFVEVKTRRSAAYGNPKYAITPKKQRKISMTALYYLKRTDQIHAEARFDVLTIQSLYGETRIEHIENAFELAYP
jgi:putative endonuclease